MNRPQAEQIAYAVSTVRPDWLRSSLVTMLGNLPTHLRDKPARDVMLALVWLAYDPDQETPRLLREDGPWWNLARLAGPGAQPQTESGIVTWCEHGRPSGRHCPDCQQPVARSLPTEEQRAAMRQAIADAKRELSAP